MRLNLFYILHITTVVYVYFILQYTTILYCTRVSLTKNVTHKNKQQIVLKCRNKYTVIYNFYRV